MPFERWCPSEMGLSVDQVDEEEKQVVDKPVQVLEQEQVLLEEAQTQVQGC